MKEMNVFLSYCRKDEEEATNIYNYFINNQNINLHRDVIDIRPWDSIKKYMQSINSTDYIILLISDSYLKSVNCMYEVLEVMRDREYRDKIFPAVINLEIYNPISRAEYVKYWESQFKRLDETLKEISVQNLGKLNEDLKRCQDIASNIAQFLDVVSDMNNPNIKDVSVRIEEKLSLKELTSVRNIHSFQETSISLQNQLRDRFREVRERDGAEISYQAELLAHTLWNEYQDGSGGIYLLDLARIRNDQNAIENLYFALSISADEQIRETVKKWNRKWSRVNEHF